VGLVAVTGSMHDEMATDRKLGQAVQQRGAFESVGGFAGASAKSIAHRAFAAATVIFVLNASRGLPVAWSTF
jgi:hypothetical protein